MNVLKDLINGPHGGDLLLVVLILGYVAIHGIVTIFRRKK